MTSQQSLGALVRLFVLTFCLAVSPLVLSQEIKNGTVRNSDGYKVWSQNKKAWLSPLDFWQDYASQNGGLTYGISTTYPEYSKVKEHDLIIIEVASGPCLMEFFHRRWRRANDVRRWDEQFNQVGGCPAVFD